MTYNDGMWEIEVTDQFREWYEEMIPIADSLYDEHLDTLKGEGLL